MANNKASKKSSLTGGTGVAQPKPIKGLANLAKSYPRLVWPDLHGWEKDGLDHVCIDMFGVTKLGKMLTSMSNRFSFTVPFHGTFKTIEGFIMYLCAPDFPEREKLRTGRGDLLGFLRMKARPYFITPLNFKAIVADAVDCRLNQNPELLDAFTKNILPVDIYYINNKTGLRVRDAEAEFLLYSIYVAIYRCLDDETEFKPEQFRDDNEPADSDKDIYHKAAPLYQREWLAKKAAKEAADEAKAVAAKESQAAADGGEVMDPRAVQHIEQSGGSIINPLHFTKQDLSLVRCNVATMADDTDVNQVHTDSVVGQTTLAPAGTGLTYSDGNVSTVIGVVSNTSGIASFALPEQVQNTIITTIPVLDAAAELQQVGQLLNTKVNNLADLGSLLGVVAAEAEVQPG